MLELSVTAGSDRVERISLSMGILDAAPVGMVLIGGSGRVLWANQAAARILGRDAVEALLGLPSTTFIHPDHAGTTPREGEERWLRPDGGEVWVHVWATPALDPEGRVVTFGTDARAGLICQLIDLSERKQVETELEAARTLLQRRNLELERSNEELGQFAYIASHDLSEPLRVIAGHVELLADRYQAQVDDEARQWIGFAVDGCARLRLLIDDLLAFSRAAGGNEAAARVPVDEVVAGALKDLGVAISRASGVVQVDALPDIRVDPGHYRQVFTNLVGNALKFARPEVPPVVRIHAERGASEWRFVVADNGIGVPAAYRERIFRIFQRLNSREAYPGSGIGLSICRKVVERHEGRIGVDDSAEGGAAFWFTVPDAA
ncbi:MAG: sensor histidine kinase [Candidatus Dormibacteria bacterium]